MGHRAGHASKICNESPDASVGETVHVWCVLLAWTAFGGRCWTTAHQKCMPEYGLECTSTPWPQDDSSPLVAKDTRDNIWCNSACNVLSRQWAGGDCKGCDALQYRRSNKYIICCTIVIKITTTVSFWCLYNLVLPVSRAAHHTLPRTLARV